MHVQLWHHRVSMLHCSGRCITALHAWRHRWKSITITGASDPTAALFTHYVRWQEEFDQLVNNANRRRFASHSVRSDPPKTTTVGAYDPLDADFEAYYAAQVQVAHCQGQQTSDPNVRS